MMNALVQPYLFFNGRAEEALAFYQKALGATVEMMMRYSDAPLQPGEEPGKCPDGTTPAPHLIMHMAFRVGQTVICGSDGNGVGPAKFEGMSLALTVDTATGAEQAFAALAEGGKVQMPLSPTFFSERFGMVEDKFGLGWMILVKSEPPAQG